MPFRESLKLGVKRKSAFYCCRCHQRGIDVHHIIPQEDGGQDEFDNAAPLCQNCHDRYGANPQKRKEIKQMRDFWYEVVQEKYPQNFLPDNTEKINDLIVAGLEKKTTEREDVEEIKREIKKFLEKLESKVPKTPNEVQTVVDESITATKLANNVHANFQCKKCKTYVGLLIGSSNCPTCGEPIPN